jgi:hypothetical protein
MLLLSPGQSYYIFKGLATENFMRCLSLMRSHGTHPFARVPAHPLLGLRLLIERR